MLIWLKELLLLLIIAIQYKLKLNKLELITFTTYVHSDKWDIDFWFLAFNFPF